ncbi:hypothetical protein N7462_000189 [Penicillium macrosclerotiorum]|uniref:uncharacterized protein n=1 Tax=Penicillium macrosclerotiorum TaxID=303699 RepID=UPI002546D251|nr:uncharacterized protein N7462_000189 [Penicillium macrosclerotiorum]KAJ5698184.1 hypothetical protein N7462_000189 [Penicillium macrosclerotiorum]
MPGYASSPTAQYLITHSFWRHDYTVTTRGRDVYRVHTSQYSPGKPDLTFYAGPDTSGPVAGVCRYRHFSSDTEIGLGDPRDGRMYWERMHRDGKMTVRYCFRVRVGRGLQTFTWKKTSMGQGTFGNLKLVDEAGRVVAVLSSGSTFSKRTGQLDVYAQYGGTFPMMVLFSGIALREKLRRASNNAAAAAASSGGAAAGAAGGGC